MEPNQEIQNRINELQQKLDSLRKPKTNLPKISANQEVHFPEEENKEIFKGFLNPKSHLKEKPNKGSGRYDRDIGDLAESKDIGQDYAERLRTPSPQERIREIPVTSSGQTPIPQNCASFEEFPMNQQPNRPYTQQPQFPPPYENYSYYPMYPMYYPPVPHYDIGLKQQVDVLQAQLAQQMQFIQNQEMKNRQSPNNLQEVVESKEKEISNLKKELENSHYTIMELEDQVRAFQSREEPSSFVEELESRNQELEQKLSKHPEDSSEDLKKQNEDLFRELRSERMRAEELENRLNASKKKVQNLEKQLEKAEDRVFSAETDLKESQKKLEECSKQKTKETEDLRRQVTFLTKKLETYETRREEPNEVSKLKQQLYQTQKELEELRNSQTNPSSEVPEESFEEDSRDPVASLENKLMVLQLDKKRLESEFTKMPEHPKSIAQKRRKQTLETELDTLDTNIGNLKTKLRNLKVFH